MTYAQDDRLAEAKAMDIARVADLLEIGNLKRMGHELTGPCPQCGGDDRFSINLRKGVFQCRNCDDGRGDVIQMVRWLRGMTLPQALDWLCGPLDAITPEERAVRRRQAEASRQKSERIEKESRDRAIRQAEKIWKACAPAEGTAVRDYLTLRGFGADVLPTLPKCLKFHPALAYMDPSSRDGDGRELHRGPAMVAAIQQPGGRARAVHRTWLDLSDPKGKAVILHPDTGRVMPAKKAWGSKKGGAIRLHTPEGAWDTLVSAEGIETTLTALVSGRYPGAAFWSLVDLGNFVGRRQPIPGKRHSDLPDMADSDAFLPPPWVRRWVLVEDGDSEPVSTRAKLVAGARRAMARIPGLRAVIIPCPAGKDLNDLLMEGEDVE